MLNILSASITAAMASLNEDALSVWSTIAPDWDASMGQDGNEYWEVLEKPSLERMFEEKRVQAGSAASPAALRALDISTGNGLTSRWLALFLGGGVEVTATDGSMAMLERARSRAADAGLQNVRFAKLDVSQPVDFAPFIEEAQAVGLRVPRCATWRGRFSLIASAPLTPSS